MQSLRLTAVATTLRLRDLLLKGAVEVAGFQLLSCAGHRRVFQPEVDADGFLEGYTMPDGNLHRQA